MKTALSTHISSACGNFGSIRFWCCFLSIAAMGAVTHSQGTEPTLSDEGGPLFLEATHQFKTLKTTRYQHKTEVDRTEGSYRYDCVGFVSYLLKESAPKARKSAFEALEIKPGRIPTPGKYASFFTGLADKPQEGWKAVAKASELRPGDVVAWKLETETSNGHAVVIASVPVEGPDGEWIVKVFDSTAAYHADDSRKTDERAEPSREGGNRSGLGHGMMAFTADPKTGVLTGYRWSPKSKSVICPIAAGRPTS
jgi:hypothetical protein